MSNNESKIIISASDQTSAAFKSIQQNIEGINSKVGGLQSSFKGLGSTMSALGGITVLAGITTAFTSSIKSAIDLADSFDNIRQRTGVAVESLGGLKFLADQTDNSLETLAKGIRKVSQIVLDASRGNDEAAASLRRLGLNYRELAKLSPENQFHAIIEATRGLKEEQRALAIQDVLGPKLAELATLSDLAAEEYKGLIEQGKGLYSITAEQAKAAADFNDNLDLLNATASSVGITIAGPLVESISTAIKRMKEAQVAGRGFIDTFSAFISGAFEDRPETDPEKVRKNIAETEALIARKKSILDKARSDLDPSKNYSRERYEIERTEKELAKLDLRLIASRNRLKELGVDDQPKPPLKTYTGVDPKPAKDSKPSSSPSSSRNTELERMKSEAKRAYEGALEPLEKFNAELRQQNELYTKGFHTTEEYTKIIGHMSTKYYESSDAAKQFKSDQESAKKALENSLSPAEKFQTDLTQLHQLYESGHFSLEEYRKVVGKLSTDFDGAANNGKKSFNRLEEYAISASRNIQSAFSDSIFNFLSGQGNAFDNLKTTFLRVQSEKLSLSIFDSFDKHFGEAKLGKSLGEEASSAFTSGIKRGDFSSFVKDALSNAFSFGGSSIPGSSSATTNSAINAFRAIPNVQGGFSTNIKPAIGTSSTLGSIGSSVGGMMSSVGAAMGPIGAVIAAAMAATTVFRSFAGDKRLGGGFGKALNKVGDIPIIGDVLPIIPLLNTFFGRGPYKLKQRNFQGEVSENSNVESNIWDSLKSKGGLFVKNKWKGVNTDTDEKLEAEFSNTIKGFKKGISDVSDVLNISAEATKNFKAKFDIIINHKDQEKAKKQIEDLFTSFGDTMTSMVMPTIDTLKSKGESLFEAFQRVGNNFKSLVDATVILGRSLQDGRDLINNFGHASGEAFIGNFDSLDQFNQLVQFYEQNFLSTNDVLKRKQEELSAALAKLGLNSNLSREEFRKLIESVDDIGGISQETFAKLIKLAPLFDEVTDGVDALNTSLETVSVSLDQLKSDVRSAYDRRSNELQGVKDQFKGIIDSLKSFKQSLNQGSLSPLTPAQKLDDARTTLNRTLLSARLGNADAIENFPKVAEEFLQASQIYNASSAAYQSDFQLIKNLLDEMENLSQSQISDADKQLDKLNEQVKGLIDINKSVQSVEDAINKLRDAIANGKGNASITADQIRSVISDPNISVQDKVRLANENGISDQQIHNAVPTLSLQEIADTRRRYSGSNITDQQIKDFVAANRNDLMAVYNAAVANGVSRFRLADVTGWKVTDIEEWVRKNNVAMFERGSDFVPRTGMALLHRGESVVPSGAISILNKVLRAIESLTHEQRIQTGDLIASGFDSNEQNAQSVAESITRSVRDAAYYQRSYNVIGMR